MAKKFYVVWDGHTPGIYESWDECLAQVKSYPGAKYKSYKSLDAAREAYSMSYANAQSESIKDTGLSKEQLAKIGSPIMASIAVDAACSGNPGRMEYQGVWTEDKAPIFHQGPFEDATNNVGEFLAIVHALAMLKKNGNNTPIYTDSRNAMIWVKKKKCNTKLARTYRNANVFDLITRAENWLKANTWTNEVLKWETKAWGEIPADFGRK